MARTPKPSSHVASERLLPRLFENTFLRSAGCLDPRREDGRRLCDAIVVHWDHVFIFLEGRSSALENAASGGRKIPESAWRRWKKEAVERNLRKIGNAGNYVRSAKQVFLNHRRRKSLAIASPRKAKLHGLLVVRGAEKARGKRPGDGAVFGVFYGNQLPGGGGGGFFMHLDRRNPAHVLEAVGPEEGKRFLARLARANLAERMKSILALAGGVSREFSGREGWSVAVSRMCAEISKNLADALSEKKKGIWNKDKIAFSPGTVENLLSSFLSAGLEEEAAQAADIVLNDPESASPDRVIPRALERLRGFRETAAFSKLWERSAGFLLERSENPPEEPGDWAISPPSGPRGGCGCALCVELVGFCEDPVATERRFTAVESLRNHLTGVVEEDSLDISLRTEKDRRPYTLVCTKNRASHERGLKRYEEDTVEMKRLLAAATPAAGELAKRLRKAVGTDQQGFREP